MLHQQGIIFIRKRYSIRQTKEIEQFGFGLNDPVKTPETLQMSFPDIGDDSVCG
jgi:hypothetical protein